MRKRYGGQVDVIVIVGPQKQFTMNKIPGPLQNWRILGREYVTQGYRGQLHPW
ncbi:hypothetical protein B0H19DRAFT_1153118 [Mycena capillaripes]|nr:hypothetical protein B0H19DRAFT_1153118 [Mycena capillaripes]